MSPPGVPPEPRDAAHPSFFPAASAAPTPRQTAAKTLAAANTNQEPSVAHKAKKYSPAPRTARHPFPQTQTRAPLMGPKRKPKLLPVHSPGETGFFRPARVSPVSQKAQTPATDRSRRARASRRPALP